GTCTAARGLDDANEFVLRLGNLAQTLSSDRLILLNKQRVVVFDSGSQDTVGLTIPVVASKRITGVGEARTVLGDQTYLAAAVGMTPTRDPLGASYVLVARPQASVTGAAAVELVPRLLEAGGAALLLALLLALIVSLSLTRAATVVHEESERLLRMAQELLDLARVEAGSISIHITAVDLGGHLDQQLVIVRPRADARQLKLELDVPVDTPPVAADPERLHQ